MKKRKIGEGRSPDHASKHDGHNADERPKSMTRVRPTRPSAASIRRDEKREKRRNERLLADQRQHILYNCAPADAEERDTRRREQKRRAKANGYQWKDLTEREKEKKIRFGSKAYCRCPGDALDLATINGAIVNEREVLAVEKWSLNGKQRRTLDAVIGFGLPDRLIASNKLVTAQLALQSSRNLCRLFERKRKSHNFLFLTFINEPWHTLDTETELPSIDAIKRLIRDMMRKYDLDYVGFVEFDSINNYPKGPGGKWIMPHVHLIAWSKKLHLPETLAKAMRKSRRLKSLLGVKTVEISNIHSVEEMAHKSFYMAKPNTGCKSLGKNRKTGKPKLFTVSKKIRDVATMRMAEIRSGYSVKQLCLAGGKGLKVKARILTGLNDWLDQLPRPVEIPRDIGAFWDEIVPAKARKVRPRVTMRG